MHVILNSANHQATSITAISSPSAGDTVEAYAALSANITATFNNRNNADANGTDATDYSTDHLQVGITVQHYQKHLHLQVLHS